MGDIGESSSLSHSLNVKPVIVRVKRKASQSPLEAFWFEINDKPLKKPLLDFERFSISEINDKPLKKPLLDFERFSISESTENEELKSKKIFVQHLETLSSSHATVDVLQSFVDPNSVNTDEHKVKIRERKRTFREGNSVATDARFEQVWKKRRENKENIHDDSLNEICHLYDVVRVDGEKDKSNKEQPHDTSLEDKALLFDYLPLLSECLPSVAEEIQSDMQSYLSEHVSKDDYVYDLYAVQNELNTTDEDDLKSYPLVQVDYQDDFYDGPSESDFETDDSNAEDNPLNEYPDEETAESENDDDEDDEDECRMSSDESVDHRIRNEHLLYDEEGYYVDKDYWKE